MDTLSAMKLFIRVAEAGTISDAARSLGISKTAASKRLQDFETALKVRLFNRTTRHVSLTEAGRDLHARLSGLLGEVESALERASESNAQPSGVLRVVARRSFGMLHVVPALASFREACPQVEIDLTLTEEVDLSPTHGTDVAIRLGLPTEKSVVSTKLASAKRILCASPKYLSHSPPMTKPDDLAGHACLYYRRDYEPAVWVFETDAGRQEISVSGPVRSNSGEVLRKAAIDGLGVVLLPEWMLAQDVAAGRLIVCLPEINAYPAPYQAEIYAVHARSEFVPAKITAFVEHLRGHLAQAEG